jgi:hypothetical protein
VGGGGRGDGAGAGGFGDGAGEEVAGEFLGPDGDEFGAGGGELVGGVHAPGDADGADAGGQGVADVAGSVGDQDGGGQVGAGGAGSLVVGDLAAAAVLAARVGQERPEGRRLVGHGVAAEDVREAVGDAVVDQHAAQHLHRVGGDHGQGAVAGQPADHVDHAGDHGRVVLRPQACQERLLHLLAVGVAVAEGIQGGEDVAAEQVEVLLRAGQAEAELVADLAEHIPGRAPGLDQGPVQVEHHRAGGRTRRHDQGRL